MLRGPLVLVSSSQKQHTRKGADERNGGENAYLPKYSVHAYIIVFNCLTGGLLTPTPLTSLLFATIWSCDRSMLFV